MRSTFSVVRTSALIRVSSSASRSSFASLKASNEVMNSSKAVESSAVPAWLFVSGAAECVSSSMSQGSFLQHACGSADRGDQPRGFRRSDAAKRLDGVDPRLGKHREGDDRDL